MSSDAGIRTLSRPSLYLLLSSPSLDLLQTSSGHNTPRAALLWPHIRGNFFLLVPPTCVQGTPCHALLWGYPAALLPPLTHESQVTQALCPPLGGR